MEELNSCSCCLVRPPDKGLKTLYKHLDKTEIYDDMLKDCFDISLGMGAVEYGICESCVARLRDAYDFKQQVQRSQAELPARVHMQRIFHAMDEPATKSEMVGENETNDYLLSNEDSPLKLEPEMSTFDSFSDREASLPLDDEAVLGVGGGDEAPLTTLTSQKTSHLNTTTQCKYTLRRKKIQPTVRHKEKKFSCKVCMKQFSQNEINGHMCHTRNKYFCNVCKQGFSRKSVLTKHMLTHTVEPDVRKSHAHTHWGKSLCLWYM